MGNPSKKSRSSPSRVRGGNAAGKQGGSAKSAESRPVGEQPRNATAAAATEKSDQPLSDRADTQDTVSAADLAADLTADLEQLLDDVSDDPSLEDEDPQRPDPADTIDDSQSRTDADADLVDDKVAEFGREDADLNPQTCCPNCQTIFEVSLELLSSSDTRVRCGECLSIFDALANLRDSDGLDDDLLVDMYGNVSDRATGTGGGERAVGDRSSASPSVASSLPDARAAALAGLARDTSSLDVTYSDFDLFSADAGLPEVPYFDQTRENSQFDFDDLAEDENDETFSDTLFAQDVTVDARSALRDGADADDDYDLHNIALDSDIDYVSDEGPRKSIEFKYQERETRMPGQVSAESRSGQGHTAATTMSASRHTATLDSVAEGTAFQGTTFPGIVEPQLTIDEEPVGSWWFRSMLFLIVVLIAAALYGYRERDTLQHNTYLRPLLESACQVLNCTLAEQVDLASLRVIKRSVFSHPSLDNVLIINVGFVNEADFAQPYPVLEIRLTDRNGRLVVKNEFEPADYLDSWQQGDVLDVGKRLDISLNVEDPGRTAMSFELDFR